jgi:hypothetical protein
MRFDPKSLGSFKRAGLLFAASAAAIGSILGAASLTAPTPPDQLTVQEATDLWQAAVEKADADHYYRPQMYLAERQLQLAQNRERQRKCEEAKAE